MAAIAPTVVEPLLYITTRALLDRQVHLTYFNCTQVLPEPVQRLPSRCSLSESPSWRTCLARAFQGMHKSTAVIHTTPPNHFTAMETTHNQWQPPSSLEVEAGTLPRTSTSQRSCVQAISLTHPRHVIFNLCITLATVNTAHFEKSGVSHYCSLSKDQRHVSGFLRTVKASRSLQMHRSTLRSILTPRDLIASPRIGALAPVI